MAEPGQGEFQPKQDIPKFEIPPKGTHVRVERHTGEVELGWTVVGENPLDKKIMVTRKVDAPADVPENERKILRKDLTREEFINQNPVPGIDDVNSFDELKDALNRVSSVRGSETNYSNKDVLKIIERVRSGQGDISEVTRTGGLRDKVSLLLSRNG